MDFACSHVVCNWRPSGAASTGVSVIVPQHDKVIVKQQEDQPKQPPHSLPPPLPPRVKKSLLAPPRPAFLTSPTRPSHPPPVPPRVDLVKEGCALTANVNVVSLGVGKLVNVRRATETESFESLLLCGKCSAALSRLSLVQRNVWLCEFCGYENGVSNGVRRMCVSHTSGLFSDELYLPTQSEDAYQNLEDTLVVFCVDISGSMSVTTEVATVDGSETYKSRLEGIQDALKRAVSSLLEQSPNSRVALVTFNDEVVIYGDGTRTPLILRDWALVDYDHLWQQGIGYKIPHCIAETFQHLTQRIDNLSEHGATSLGPAVLASVAVASRYPGSKVILCTDGKANIGLGKIEETPFLDSSHTPHFYKQLAEQAVNSGVIISVMTFEGTDCRLADIGKLADATGGRVNMVSIGTVAAEIQLASTDNVLATQAKATLIAPSGVYFPYEDENNHKVTTDIGNVTKGLEITFQFAVKSNFMAVFLQRDLVPFQIQLSFKTRDQQRFTRVITEKRPVTTCSQLWPGSLNMAILGVHCAQLCARLTMEGHVQDAQRHLKAQHDLLSQVSKQRPIQKEETTYTNWMDTLTIICDDITTESQRLSDEAAKIIYQMKRATSVKSNNSPASDKRWKKK
ncbi:circularly permutated Ras protein 1 isoform X2 [Nelusetta ayraudi]|uniref:circularly permutated Ras protein 1 isoform X2 n=1 Tax=Nelusetta ayraudi TaxID=303726 RepID=UPI003F6EE085